MVECGEPDQDGAVLCLAGTEPCREGFGALRQSFAAVMPIRERAETIEPGVYELSA
jgi:hypothetical protein